MIKGIIFDFGNVIRTFDRMVFIRRLARSSPYSEDELYRRIFQDSTLLADYETGKLTSMVFYEGVKEVSEHIMEVKGFRDAFVDIFTPIKETSDIIRKLKGRYKLALLSNTNEWHHERAISEVEVYPLFDAITVSYQVGVKKPDERIYQDCLGKLGLRPEECIYIDDIREYADKATELGMKGHWYRAHSDLIEFMTSEGIEVETGSPSL
ncbi:MAG: HAD family hydrolase [Thermoplasmatota archaeon]